MYGIHPDAAGSAEGLPPPAPLKGIGTAIRNKIKESSPASPADSETEIIEPADELPPPKRSPSSVLASQRLQEMLNEGRARKPKELSPAALDHLTDIACKKEAKIQSLVTKARGAAQNAILAGAEYGAWLCLRKKNMGHGHFLNWLGGTDTSEDRAERLMKLGKELLGPNSADVRKMLANTKSFNQALRAVKITEEPQPTKKKPGNTPDEVEQANKFAGILARKLAVIAHWEDTEEFKRLRHSLESIVESYKRLLKKPDAAAKDDLSESEDAPEPIDI